MNELRLKSFLGIDFGSSPENAKRKILRKTGCIYDRKNSSEEILLFNGSIFTGQNKALIMLLFENKKFCKSTIHIQPKMNSLGIENYKRIQNELNSKYFITNDNVEIYEEPYEKNDGYTETGISLGKVNFSSHWRFPNPNGGLGDSISLKISKDHTIIVDYEHRNDFSGGFHHSFDETLDEAKMTCFALVSFILFLYIFIL